jgi:hypothetical protein
MHLLFRAPFLALLVLAACRTGTDDAARASSSADAGSPTSPPDGPSPDASTSAPPATPQAVCEAYIQCVSKTNPGGLGIILAAYGPHGSCWGAADDALCTQGCLAGLRQSRTAFPNELACPECLGDDECDNPGKRACDRPTGICVACNADAHCPKSAPACDVARHTCVGCNTDAQCSGATPACDVATHTCVACNTDAQCPHACEARTHTCIGCHTNAQCPSNAPVCQAATSTCCAPPSCGQLKAQMGTKRWICGSIYDSCTNVDCGGCTQGQCLANECSTAGTTCTPGQPTCAQGEICVYDADRNGYFCSYDYNGASCTYPDFNGDQCANAVPGGGLQRFGFDCGLGGTCEQTCKSSSECAGGRTCRLYQGETWGVCGP